MKILIIDDEKPTLSMFRLFLAAYGYEVHTAENGDQGLQIFELEKPEIVFTDIRMPGMDGLEVLDRIRKADPKCQVVVITGHGDMERALEAMDLGASDFINKPVERQALNAALVRAEKRVSRSEEPEFHFNVEKENDKTIFNVEGRLSGDWGGSEIQAAEVVSNSHTIEFRFHPEFSIDRAGVLKLTQFLQTVDEKGGRV
ncbi:MAG: response regulator, partial [Desulfobacterales bacterium]|nr:response regulator [Desulfobacterales bacterium]